MNSGNSNVNINGKEVNMLSVIKHLVIVSFKAGITKKFG